MKPKVSIIVPIYNMESYLTRCLDSLLSQSLADLEIITVNDGSTDASAEILYEYAEKDNRIVVIIKQNGGVSSARNAGIQAAKGEYIGFVDPDDWVDTRMYEAMYNAAIHDQADIVMCTYIREFAGHSKEKNFPLPDKVCYDSDEVRSKVLRRLVGPLNKEVANPEFLDAWGTVWSKLYRSEIIKENRLQFIDLKEIGSNEDSLFNIHALYYARSFVFLNRPYYHYWRGNTTSVTSRYNPALMNQFMKLYSIIEGLLNERQMKQEFHLALNNRICLNTLGLGLNAVSKGNKESPFMKMNEIRMILNHNRIRRSFKQFEMADCPIVWRTFFFCAKCRFSIGFYLMLVAIDWLRKTIR
jgi:glycosyltransferase involved in cell wall biosynthesis